MTAESLARQRNIVLVEKIFCFFMCLPFCEMEGLISLGINWDLYTSIHCLVLIFLTGFIWKGTNKLCLLYGVFYCIILISTYLTNPNNSYIAVYYGGRMICYIMLFDIYTRQKKLYLLLSTLKFILGIQILITFVYQIIAQDFFGLTISNNYVNFLTPDNSLGQRYVPFILITYLVDYYGSRKKRYIDFIFWSCMCLFSLLKAWAATGLSCYIIFLLLLLLPKRGILNKLTPIKSLIINFCISFTVIFLHVQRAFSYLINSILGKAYSISIRESIWASAVLNVLKKPLLGYGTGPSGRVVMNYARLNGLQYFSHNMFLEILIQGGLIALLTIVIIYFCASFQMRKVIGHTEIVCVISVAVFSILLMQTFEWALYDPLANLPLILCFFVIKLVKEEHSERVHISMNSRGAKF